MLRYIISISVFLFLCASAFAQVTIAPTNLFIDDSNRFGTYLVLNNSNQNQEISIDFFFGYTETDENGSRRLINSDSLKRELYSIDQNVRAFPQNFVLAPGTRQVVRLRIAGGNNLDDGTYWARIKTKSSQESAPVELQTSDAVSAQIGIVIEQVTGLFYKKGNVTTGIEIQNISVSEDSDNMLTVLTKLKRTGNSPFLGTVTTELMNTNGTVVKEGIVSTSIYFDGAHKQEIDISDIAPGTYQIRVSFETQRNDIQSTDIVQMPTVTQSTTYIIR